MTSTTMTRNGNGSLFLKGAPETLTREGEDNLLLPANGVWPKTENRLHGAAPTPPILREETPARETRHALAVFCYAEPESAIGDYVSQTVAALGRRKTPVHLFTRHDFGLTIPGVSEYPVGNCQCEDLLDSVQEFASRSCNAFLQQFPAGCPNVTLLGYEWSAMPVLSILRGIKSVNANVSLHSLERQRSDMTSAISKRIEQIELTGLREAKTVLVHEPATAEVAKYWVPECADRIVNARSRFPAHHYETKIDPGAIKARYQVGPVDPTILFIGDLEDRYGPDMLIKAMPALLKNNKQVRLIIVGAGSLYWPLRVYTRYLLLEPAVRLAGSVEGQAAHELIQAADVVAVPSRESTPWWPILAGWAAHRPVVATHQAAPALLEHEQDCVRFYPSENSCVWGIERVLFDPEFGKTIARRGNAKLEERFGWNSQAVQVEELMGVPAK